MKPNTHHELQEAIAKIERSFAERMVKEVENTSLRIVAASYGFPSHVYLWRFLRRVLGIK